MSSDKHTPPSKDDLLDELESIRDFLNDEESSQEIPTLTMVAEHESTEEEPTEEEKLEETSAPAADKKLKKEDGAKPKKRISKTSSKPNAAASVKQDSLFDEPEPDQIDPEDDLNPYMPKARGENPFLPPHIRERLGRHKEMFESLPEEIVNAMQNKERAEVQGDLLAGFTQAEKAVAQSLSGKTYSPDEQEALIDELVAEFLPKIEAKLRAKLREASFKDIK